MSLSRAFLKGMGLTEEQVGAIVEAHTDTVDALKEQRDSYKADAEKLAEVQKENEELKAANADGIDYKKKYEAEKSAFEKYKTAEKEKETLATKTAAYKSLLKEAGIDERRIDSITKLADIAGLTLTEDGKIEGADEIKKGAQTEWADFIVQAEQGGAKTQTPPENHGAEGVDLDKLTMAEYIAARKKG